MASTQIFYLTCTKRKRTRNRYLQNISLINNYSHEKSYVKLHINKKKILYQKNGQLFERARYQASVGEAVGICSYMAAGGYKLLQLFSRAICQCLLKFKMYLHQVQQFHFQLYVPEEICTHAYANVFIELLFKTTKNLGKSTCLSMDR